MDKIKDFSHDSELTNDNLVDHLHKILDKIPKLYRDLIEEGFKYKRVPKEYLLSSILYAISSAIGKTFYTNELNYINYANCYFIIVGSRGDAKSEALKIASKPIIDFDNDAYDIFDGEMQNDSKDDGSVRKQILIQDATIEKAQLILNQNLSGVGLFYDEIRAIVQKMNNPNSRDGHEWLIFLLEAFTNGLIDVGRKTTDSFRIKKAYVTMIGGIQHQFIKDLLSDSLVGSGLIDRLLFTNIITSNTKVSRENINDDVLRRYGEAIGNLVEYKKQSEQPDETEREHRILYTLEAQDLLFEYTQKLENQKTEATPPLKEYYSKLIIYMHKLIIICFLMKHAEEKTFKSRIDKETVLLAKDMIEFYLLNFRKSISYNNSLDVSIDGIIKLAKKNEAPQTAVIKVTGYSKSQVSKLWSRV